MSISDDFWGACDRSGGAEACWPWLRCINTSGYGSLFVHRRWSAAHRHAYTLAFGPIPPRPGYHGTVVMHTCDNRRCVNPAHLRLGSQRDNNADRDAKGRAKDRPRGEQSHNSRFSIRDVVCIREGLADGISPGALATLYGCHRSAIWHIKSRRTWAWLPPTVKPPYVDCSDPPFLPPAA